MANHLLVLCDGNVCRSPMAEGLLRRALPGWDVTSAGLHALVGRHPEPFAIELMKERLINVDSYRARQVTSTMLRDADLVLTMTLAQQRRIEGVFPYVMGRVFRIRQQAAIDVADPYRLDRDAFRQALADIEDGVGAWVPLLNNDSV